MFHRIDNPLGLSSSRYFRLVELLPSYEGALRAALVRAQSEESGPLTDPVAADVSPETLAALSDSPGFPGIEFTGG